jgi:hypothetical protein
MVFANHALKFKWPSKRVYAKADCRHLNPYAKRLIRLAGYLTTGFLGLRVRFPPGNVWMSLVSVVLSGRGLCDGWSLLQRGLTECSLSGCDLEISTPRTPRPTGCCRKQKKKKLVTWILLYFGLWVRVVSQGTDGGSRMFWNVGTFVPNYVASYPRRERLENVNWSNTQLLS